jgi:hypothetical protein
MNAVLNNCIIFVKIGHPKFMIRFCNIAASSGPYDTTQLKPFETMLEQELQKILDEIYAL